ncbi:MAG TPA: trigger factor [Gammaproteobacteria bacterium]|nr:trigger factor [Gammaproteobacteria bacterium]
MQVSVEAIGGLGKRMTVDVPAEKIETEVTKRLKSLQPTVKLQGFRPGKVPMSVIKKRFAGKIRQEVTGEVVSLTFVDAVNKEDLKPAGVPKIEAQSHDPASGLRYVAVFDVYPEIKITGVEDIKIERDVVEIQEADIDSMIEKLRKQRCGWKAVERAAKVGDRLNTDFIATINGETFAGGEGKDLQVIIGENSMIAGFEDGLLDAEVDQTVEMDLTFPADFSDKDIAGKQAHFNVLIKAIEEPELPELDDEFVKVFGVTEGGVEAFREEIKISMSRELDGILKSKIKKSVMDELLANNTFELPESLIADESKRLAEKMSGQTKMRQGNHSPKNPNPFEASQFAEEARRRVALGLIIGEIINENELKAPEEEVREKVESIASSYHDPNEVISWYYQDKARLTDIESMVLEDLVVDWVLGKAQVIDNAKTFDEIAEDAA